MVHYLSISTICRVLALLLIIPTIVCVGLGQYLCVKLSLQSTTVCSTLWPITSWSEEGQLGGQYFCFTASLFIFVLLILLLAGGTCPYKMHKNCIVSMCAFGALVMLICFCLEAWYCSGFDVPKLPIAQYYQSWLAATIFFFVIMVLFVIDAIATSRGAIVKAKATTSQTYGYSKPAGAIVPHTASTYSSPHLSVAGSPLNHSMYYASSAAGHPGYGSGHSYGYQSKSAWGHPMYHY